MPCDRPRSEARYEGVVVRAAHGDQSAIDELIEVLRPRLSEYCRRLLRDPDDAPQVLEATLLDVVAALPAMRDRRAPFPSWAYGLAAQRARSANGDGDVATSQELLDQLTMRQRQILEVLSEGLSIGQVARSLYISEGTVARLYREVVRKLGTPPRGPAMRPILRELLSEDRRDAPADGEAAEDRDEEGDLDLPVARAALLADLRATLRDEDVPTRRAADHRADAVVGDRIGR